tara:strand:+ start:5997 stop:6287 length:291 start_codon:yes stop_codon:yes gene_type:complete
MSSIEIKVCDKIAKRAEVGKKKYGTTMDRTDLTTLEWLKHTQEELMDACVYIEKLLDEKQEKKSCKNCRCKGGVSEWVRTSSMDELEATPRKGCDL